MAADMRVRNTDMRTALTEKIIHMPTKVKLKDSVLGPWSPWDIAWPELMSRSRK
jgi:hypothetical protein